MRAENWIYFAHVWICSLCPPSRLKKRGGNGCSMRDYKCESLFHASPVPFLNHLASPEFKSDLGKASLNKGSGLSQKMRKWFVLSFWTFLTVFENHSKSLIWQQLDLRAKRARFTLNFKNANFSRHFFNFQTSWKGKTVLLNLSLEGFFGSKSWKIVFTRSNFIGAKKYLSFFVVDVPRKREKGGGWMVSRMVVEGDYWQSWGMLILKL